jgi:ABC-2 type transport system ATP-binding protein
MLKMPGDAIRLEAIGKSFGCVTVLKDVTLRVRAGEILALVGSNGAGKTTLLELLATVQLPTSGRAIVGGFDLVDQADQIKRIVGYCPAGAESFYPRLTGRANLEFFAALYGLCPPEARTRTRAVLDMMGVAEAGEVVVQRYSAGMKQKLNLARALLPDAPILLLDEPTISLDTDARRQLHGLLRHLAGAANTTVLLVTHDAAEAHAVCDRVALLNGGAIARVRTVEAATALHSARLAAG